MSSLRVARILKLKARIKQVGTSQEMFICPKRIITALKKVIQYMLLRIQHNPYVSCPSQYSPENSMYLRSHAHVLKCPEEY